MLVVINVDLQNWNLKTNPLQNRRSKPKTNHYRREGFSILLFSYSKTPPNSQTERDWFQHLRLFRYPSLRTMSPLASEIAFPCFYLPPRRVWSAVHVRWFSISLLPLSREGIQLWTQAQGSEDEKCEMRKWIDVSTRTKCVQHSSTFANTIWPTTHNSWSTVFSFI